MGIDRRVLRTVLGVSVGGLAARGLARLAGRSGVTNAEIARALPGDELVPDAQHVVDRGATLPATVAAVWPWLVQLGKQRAGWYFPRWLEIVTPPSRRGLRVIDASLLDVSAGERVPDWGPGDPQFEVAVIEPEAALVYLSLRQKSRNWTWPDNDDPLPADVLALSWALVLSPVHGDRSRLHLRLRMRTAREHSPLMVLGGLFDWVTVALLFAGLRERLRTRS